MAHAWEADRTISLELARSLIESQFPQLAPATISPLAVGWDNTAFLVNGEYVFRFPRREIAVALIDTEHRVLPAIAPTLPLAIPVPVFLGEPGEAFGWPFAGYRYLTGRAVCDARLDVGQRAAIAMPLAKFLAALHAFPVDEARRLGVVGDSIGRLDLENRIPRTHRNLKQLQQRRLIESTEPWQWIIRALEDKPHATRDTLVHGDLYALHILVDDDGRICGVIDWGDVHIGGAAVDLSIAHGLLPASSHDAFRGAYGEIDDATWRLARFRALYHATVTTAYAQEIGHDNLLAEGLGLLDRLRAPAA